MDSTRKGIIAGGNWIIDLVKIIDAYPQEDALANIQEESQANGGSPYNILKDLCKLKANFPLEGIGLVGHDDKGKYILDDCAAHHIQTTLLKSTTQAPTSYTDVMSVRSTGRRTFFHQRGANALLDMEHFDLEHSNAKIFHLGYLLLLDQLDQLDAEGRTRASYVFEKAQNLGFEVSADIVSETSDRFESIVKPSLPFIDYLFVNEYEAGKITHIDTLKNGQIDLEKAIDAAKRLILLGVKKAVVLHFPHGCIAVNAGGDLFLQGSVQLEQKDIIGAAGAGDAFAAGILLGLHDGYAMQACLEMGVAAAATSLYKASCSDGVLPLSEALVLAKMKGFRKLS